MKENCIFCKIINGEVPSKILYEDNDIMILLDAYPDTDGHALVIPKKHYEDIYDVDSEIFNKMINKAKEYAQIIMEKLNKKGVTFLINYGDAQAIKHLHLHLSYNYKIQHNQLNIEWDNFFLVILLLL